MAYTPINWQTGDTITADKLNCCDNGWGVSSSQLFSETVTTADQGGLNQGELAYSFNIDAATITVTFDGTDYTCSRVDAFGSHYYGGFTESGPDFTYYPFVLLSRNGNNSIYTETAGSYMIAAEAAIIEKSDNFSKAVGYWNESMQLFSEIGTTVEEDGFNNLALTYSNLIDSDTIIVTFDDINYTCVNLEATSGAPFASYGAPWSNNDYDFSEYPFNLYSDGQTNSLTTETSGTHTIAVVADGVAVSDDFSHAVNACVIPADTSTMPMCCISGTTTRSEIEDAIDSAKLVYFWTSSHGCFFITKAGRPFTIFPEVSGVTATHDNYGIFFVTES